MKEFSANAKAAGKKIALVPTMGALHDGHLSLIDKAKSLADVVVVSVFVNPTQFGPNEDYDKYPRQLKADVAKCEEHAADVVFAPSPSDIYAPGRLHLRLGRADKPKPLRQKPPQTLPRRDDCCKHSLQYSKARLRRFRRKGRPAGLHHERMVRDLFMDVEIVRAPIVREQSGLALSSRNKYMTQAERDGATRIRKSLLAGKALVDEGCTNIDRVKALVINTLADPKTRIIYVEIVDAKTSLPVSELAKGKCRISLAVWYGQTRLIDNIVV